jgi:hypothetical protein
MRMRETIPLFLTAIAVAMIWIFLFGSSPAAAQSCGELRQACMMKDQLGEAGRGNCRAYREQCTQREERQRPDISCEALRAMCMFKGELGMEGQGNCRRYREQCGR